MLLLFPFLLVAQTVDNNIPVHLREIPRHNLSIELGLVEPTGDYRDISRSGLGVGISYDYYFNKYAGLSIAARHTYNETALAANEDVDNNSLSSITAGIITSKTFNRFQIDGFARLGVGYLSTNDRAAVSQNNGQIYARDKEKSKDIPLVLDVGLRFNYYFRRSVQLYFSPQYQTTLGNALAYNNRQNIFDPSDPVFVDNQQPSFNFSNFIFSVGVKIAVGKRYTNGELRDDTELDN